MEKCSVLHFGGSNLRNGASYALRQYRTSRRIECYHLRAPKRTGLHVALSQHRHGLLSSCSELVNEVELLL